MTEPRRPAIIGGMLGPVEIRELADRLGVRPTKSLGQNFVHDPNTVRRIVRTAGLTPDDVVLEVGSGLGSLTLGLLPACLRVIAVEVDARLAIELPRTVERFAPDLVQRLTVLRADALTIRSLPDPRPTTLVANLPYNVSVPVLLHLMAAIPTISHGLVMVQLEVADRLAARPGSKVYGVPSAKLAWYGPAKRVGVVSRNVFWPVPNVESGLVRFERDPRWLTSERAAVAEGVDAHHDELFRTEVFRVIDAAFGQRRKMLRSALSEWAGSAMRAEAVLNAAGIAPTARGEAIDIAGFTRIVCADRAMR